MAAGGSSGSGSPNSRWKVGGARVARTSIHPPSVPPALPAHSSSPCKPPRPSCWPPCGAASPAAQQRGVGSLLPPSSCSATPGEQQASPPSAVRRSSPPPAAKVRTVLSRAGPVTLLAHAAHSMGWINLTGASGLNAMCCLLFARDLTSMPRRHGCRSVARPSLPNPLGVLLC